MLMKKMEISRIEFLEEVLVFINKERGGLGFSRDSKIGRQFQFPWGCNERGIGAITESVEVGGRSSLLYYYFIIIIIIIIMDKIPCNFLVGPICFCFNCWNIIWIISSVNPFLFSLTLIRIELIHLKFFISSFV